MGGILHKIWAPVHWSTLSIRLCLAKAIPRPQTADIKERYVGHDYEYLKVQSKPISSSYGILWGGWFKGSYMGP